jgi:hypothetical protein
LTATRELESANGDEGCDAGFDEVRIFALFFVGACGLEELIRAVDGAGRGGEELGVLGKGRVMIFTSWHCVLFVVFCFGGLR